MADRINEQLLNEACDFLQAAGWSFGYYLVLDESTGAEKWQADAVKGTLRFVVRGPVLGEVFQKIRQQVLELN
jgi:hypothetical protein